MLIKNSNVEYLKKEYKITEAEAAKLDDNIRAYVRQELEKMEPSYEDFFSFLERSIKEKQSSSDRRRKRKKFDSTIKHYERNYGRIANQNNLFALLATVGTIICAVYQLITYGKCLEWANYFYFILFLALLRAWLFLDNLIKDRSDIRKVLTLINDACTPLIFIFNIAFYALLAYYSGGNVNMNFYVIGIIIVLLLIGGIACVSISWLKKRREL